MEPRYSMSVFALVLAASAIIVGVLAGPTLPMGATGTVAVVGALLAASYRYRTRRFQDRRLAHRRALDRIAAAQWLLPLTVTSAALLAVEGLGLAVDLDVVELRVWMIGLLLTMAVTLVSSLVDWYWILPKVGGMTGRLPCVLAGSSAFAGVTKIWLFHRAAATIVWTVFLAGVPGYLAADVADYGAAGAFWVILGTGLSLGYNVVAGDAITACKTLLNPPFNVGQAVRLRASFESPDLSTALVIDVSTQGAKYVELDNIPPMARFKEKGALLKISDFDKVRPAGGGPRGCSGPGQCRALNWYCFRNVDAYSVNGAGNDNAPAPWPAQPSTRSLSP